MTDAFSNGATNGLLGGPDAGDGNVISGNRNYGVEIFASSAITLQNNYIGTDATGETAIPNRTAGVTIVGATTDVGIGANGIGNALSCRKSSVFGGRQQLCIGSIVGQSMRDGKGNLSRRQSDPPRIIGVAVTNFPSKDSVRF